LYSCTSSVGFGSGVTTVRAKIDASVGMTASAVPARAPVIAPTADQRTVRFAGGCFRLRKGCRTMFGRLLSPMPTLLPVRTHFASVSVTVPLFEYGRFLQSGKSLATRLFSTIY